VINKGVFRFVRHPMYLAAILLYLSFLIFKLSLAALLVWIVSLLFYHLIARHEEKLLLDYYLSVAISIYKTRHKSEKINHLVVKEGKNVQYK